MSEAVRRFYGSHSTLYDFIARYTPGVGRWRRRAVQSLRLDAGDTVLDVGCGTGASFPYLRAAVGPGGEVVGIDVTRPLLDRADERAESWSNVSVAAADAATLPISGPVDGVLGSFVVGLFEDPVQIMDAWTTVLDSDGRLALIDAAPRGDAPVRDQVFGLLVRAGAPPGHRANALTRLDRRVDAAHGHLKTTGTAVETASFAFDYVRITAATPSSP